MASCLPVKVTSVRVVKCGSTSNAHTVRLSTAMRFLSTIRIVRVGLALAVALWMAGAGCLLGCENMVSAAAPNGSASAAMTATNSLTIVAAGDACASTQSHDCCAGRGAKPAANSTSKSASQPAAGSKSPAPTSVAGAEELGATPSTMRDCPLAVNARAVLSKARPDQSSSALPLTHANATLPSFHEQATALSPPPLLPNRGHTYLRCCVFLI